MLDRQLKGRLSAAAARELDAKFFPQSLGQSAPAVLRLGGRAKLKLLRRINADEAQVRTANGKDAVVQGSQPIFGVDKSGATAPVDLSLTETGTGFAPASALVPITIPTSAAGALTFPDLYLSIRFAGLNGVQSSGVRDGDSVFYANVDGAGSDTDAMINPTQVGADISWVLRSAASPKQQDLDFSMLPGWTLKATADGGVDILNSAGQAQGHVLPPQASDANGNPVASKYVVKDFDTLETEVTPASSVPVTYPILVDPSVGDFFSGASDGSTKWWLDGFWSTANTSNFTAYNTDGNYEYWYGSTSVNYPANAAAYYYHVEPSRTTAFGTQVFSVYNYTYATSTGGYTGELAGINDSSPSSGQWNDSAGGQGYNSALLSKTTESNLGYQVFCTEEWPFAPSTNAQCPASNAYPGDTIVVPGVDVTSGTPKSTPTVLADGISVYETDNVTPTVASISHTVAPGTWINPQTNPRASSDSVSMTWADTGGLGLASEVLGGSNLSSQTSNPPCTGPHPNDGCSVSNNHAFAYSLTSLPEGVDSISETATSLTGYAATTSWTMNIDETLPRAVVSCPNAGAWTDNSSTTCTITGSDPANASNGSAGSGLATLQYQTQTNGGAWSTPTSIATGGTILVSTEGVTNVRAVAVDNAGNTYTSPQSAVQLDRTAPAASVSCPGSGAYVNTNVTCTITGSDPADGSDGATGSGLAQLQYETQVNGGSWSTPTTISSGGQFAISTEGVTLVRAIATDAAANSYTTANKTIEIDQTPPAAAANCVGNGAWTNASSVSCTITGSDPANASNGTPGSGLSNLKYETDLNGGGLVCADQRCERCSDHNR